MMTPNEVHDWMMEQIAKQKGPATGYSVVDFRKPRGDAFVAYSITTGQPIVIDPSRASEPVAELQPLIALNLVPEACFSWRFILEQLPPPPTPAPRSTPDLLRLANARLPEVVGEFRFAGWFARADEVTLKLGLARHLKHLVMATDGAPSVCPGTGPIMRSAPGWRKYIDNLTDAELESLALIRPVYEKTSRSLSDLVFQIRLLAPKIPGFEFCDFGTAVTAGSLTLDDFSLDGAKWAPSCGVWVWSEFYSKVAHDLELTPEELGLVSSHRFMYRAKPVTRTLEKLTELLNEHAPKCAGHVCHGLQRVASRAASQVLTSWEGDEIRRFNLATSYPGPKALSPQVWVTNAGYAELSVELNLTSAEKELLASYAFCYTPLRKVQLTMSEKDAEVLRYLIANTGRRGTTDTIHRLYVGFAALHGERPWGSPTPKPDAIKKFVGGSCIISLPDEPKITARYV